MAAVDPSAAAPKISPPSEPTYGLIRPEDGTVAPLPPGTTYEDFLAWIAARRGPGYGINSVALVARPLEDARFEVEAEVRFVVHRTGEWVRVPLGFDEAVLTACEHEGDGAYSFARKPGETGHAWAFDAAGEHVLRLKLLTSVSTRSDETRFALSSPTDAAVTTLALDLPVAAEVTAGTGVIRSAAETEGRTRVEWVGPGGRLDLAWRPKSVAADLGSLAADTTILPTISGQTAQLRVRQRIRTEAGEVTAVTVLVPSDYTVTDVTGALFRSRRDEVNGPDRVVTIQLSEPTAGPFELNWQVTAPLTGDGRLLLTGFSLPGVPEDAQIGRVLVEQTGGYRVYAPADGISDGVKTMEMADPVSLSVAAAYEFDRQPFRVELKAEPVPPEFTVSRKLTVAVSPEALALDAEFAADVTKGEVKELEFVWPAAGWTVSPIRGPSVTEGKRVAGSDSIGLRVTSPTSKFAVSVKAGLTRDVTAGETVLTLPKLAGKGLSEAAGRETLLAFRHGDGLEVGVAARGAGAVRPASESPASLGLAETLPGERWTIFKAIPETDAISLTVRRLPLSVTAAVTASVRPQGDGLKVDERINYEIRHGSTSELRLTSPDGVHEVRIIGVDGKSLTPSKSSAGSEADSGTRHLSIPLDGAETGAFELTVSYHVPSRSSGQAVTRCPLFRPLGADVRSASLRVDPPARQTAEVLGREWASRTGTNVDEPPVWTATGIGDAVSIRFNPRREGEAAPDIPKVLLRTSVSREGIASTVADCLIARPPRFLSLHFESDAPPEFLWRGRPVAPRVLPADRGTAVELELGGAPDSGVLLIGFAPAAQGTAGVTERVSVPGFEFGQGVTVGQSAWRVTLPESQHLFTAPTGYVPRFRWTLRSGLWTRQPSPPFDDLEGWFGDGASGIEPEAGHQYVFSRDGAPQTLAFSVVSRSLVVLIGAGTAIVLGYLFANSLVPRRGVALAVLAAAFALLIGFFPDQVQVFLQPAAFGLLLVTVAAVAERLLRKRQAEFASVNPTSAVDFVTILPGEGSTSAPQASIGSEEPTVLRPGRPAAPEPVSAHRSGATP